MEINIFCFNCGAKIESGAEFCQDCGTQVKKTKTETEKVGNVKTENSSNIESQVKNYSPIFWKYFWVGVLFNIFSRGVGSAGESWLWIVFFILAGIYVYKFSGIINEAMLSIGKKNWWPLGLLSIIPFGFWIAFLIVRAKLKPHGKWVSRHKSFKKSKEL